MDPQTADSPGPADRAPTGEPDASADGFLDVRAPVVNGSVYRSVPAGADRSQRPAPGNIADPYNDLLSFLDEPHRRGLIALIAVGYYDGWRPCWAEVADLVRLRTTTDQARRQLDLHRLSRATTPVNQDSAGTATEVDPPSDPVDPLTEPG